MVMLMLLTDDVDDDDDAGDTEVKLSNHRVTYSLFKFITVIRNEPGAVTT
jgi:hypothetical protein